MAAGHTNSKHQELGRSSQYPVSSAIIPSEALCVQALVKALTSVGADASDFMNMSPYRDMVRLMTKHANEGGYSANELRHGLENKTVNAAQGLQANATIVALTRENISSHGLRNSNINRPRLINVAISRAQEMLYLFGHWQSVLALPPESDLRKTMLFMKSHFPDFLKHAGYSPWTIPNESIIAPGDTAQQLIATQTEIIRDLGANNDIAFMEREIERILEENQLAIAALNGLDMWLVLRLENIIRHNFWERAKDGINWEVPVDVDQKTATKNALRRCFITKTRLWTLVKSWGYGNEDPWRYRWQAIRSVDANSAR